MCFQDDDFLMFQIYIFENSFFFFKTPWLKITSLLNNFMKFQIPVNEMNMVRGVI